LDSAFNFPLLILASTLFLIGLLFSAGQSMSSMPSQIPGRWQPLKKLLDMAKKVNPCLIIFISAFTNVRAPGQTPATINNPVFAGADSLNVYLAINGIKLTGDNIVAFFPKDSLPTAHMQQVTDTVTHAVRAVERFIHTPLPWAVHQPTTIYTFYFRPDRFISHASMQGYLSIPFWRIKNGTAPWLHELVHEMLNTKAGNWALSRLSEEEAGKRMPSWLLEGLAEYVSLEIGKEQNWPRYDVHSSSFTANVDSLFLLERSEKADYVLSFIGRNGVIPELFSNDRRLYAPAFYHGSCSFVKYTAEQYGLSILLDGVAAFGKEQQTIEKAIGKPLKAVKKEWLYHLQKRN
jgi:hypothetical protein